MGRPRASSFLQEESQQYFYEKPGVIDNECLYEDGQKLKQLVPHFDFEAVNEEVWKHLAAWYGWDTKVCRRIVSDHEGLRLDLHPECSYLATKYNLTLQESSVESLTDFRSIECVEGRLEKGDLRQIR